MDIQLKKCSTCKIEQSLDQFHKYKGSKDGLTHRCKSCVSRRKNLPTDSKICTLCGNKKSLSEFGKRKMGKLKRSSMCKECINAKTKKYRKNNIMRIRKVKNKWRNERRKNDPIYKLECNMRCRIYDFLNGRYMKKNNTTFNIIGCSPKELKQYLENKFTDGMCWENYGYDGWHVDHIIPLDFAKTENEIYQLCHFTNLQPLWKQDNFDKGYKII
jgi:hypothetical protein